MQRLHDGCILIHIRTTLNRAELPRLLASLPGARVAEHEEVLHFVEARRLHSRGLGWIDAHLLASAVLTNVPLWTRGRRRGRPKGG